METEGKTLKQYAKEAKQRLKNGFWQNYKKDLDLEIQKAKMSGVNESKVKQYYTQKVSNDIKNKKDEEEHFYLKVKELLDNEGEVYNAIGRLTEKAVYETLTYEEKQRYNLALSERYLKAVERYKREKSIQLV